jgi:FtsP/CotA-like multicopper oxidase with cupredoxin domain
VKDFRQTALLTRRRFGQLGGMAAAAIAVPGALRAGAAADVMLEIAPYTLEASPKHNFRTIAYNGQVPGPLLRMREGQAQTIEVRNMTSDPELVHWHGLHVPSDVDGAMEEGTPMIAPGATARYTLVPAPAGFRWFHTHTFAGKNLNKAGYTGQHGFLMIDPRNGAKAVADREIFLGLHDWGGHFAGSDDGFMNPVYEASTINGKMLGFGEPVRVKAGERVLLHVLNSSPTEVHWIALPGHGFQVIALDGNAVAQPQTVPMLRLAPAERVSAVVEMNAPGVWVLGEVRKHVQAAGMGIVVEYAGATGKPVWTQPNDLVWNYRQFADVQDAKDTDDVTRIELAFDAKFQGHGSEELWLINGKTYPQTEEPVLKAGGRYRLVWKNLSMDDHPLHLHRHTFEVRRIDGFGSLRGVRKDVLLVPAKTTAEVEFVADNPGRTLFHCHQQDHMDRGFMMVFRYA